MSPTSYRTAPPRNAIVNGRLRGCQWSCSSAMQRLSRRDRAAALSDENLAAIPAACAWAGHAEGLDLRKTPRHVRLLGVANALAGSLDLLAKAIARHRVFLGLLEISTRDLHAHFACVLTDRQTQGIGLG